MKPRAKKPSRKPAGRRRWVSPRAISDVVRMTVTLLDVEPRIWRKFQVPASFTLHRLHGILQEVMGWKDSHLHAFEIGAERYGKPHPEDPEGLRDSRRATLEDLVEDGVRTILYEYDFGDGWQHEVQIEEAVPGVSSNQKPLCLAGERACPPEDSGGAGGYQEILETLRRPRSHHQEIVDWLEPGFDAELFDLKRVNANLAALP